MPERRQRRNTNPRLNDLCLVAIHSSPHGVVLEWDGSVVYVNPKFAQLSGERAKPLIGASVRELRKRCKSPLSGAEVECSHYSARVRERALRVHILRDVAAQRRLERQILESHKMEALGRLVGAVAHDFNNVLTAIRLYSDLLAGVSQGEAASRYLSEIRRSANRGSERIKQLLAIARERQMQPRVVSVNGVLRGMKDTLRRMLGERADLVTHCPKRSANVRVDPAQLEEVILNLAINGRDAIQDRGTLTIDVSVVKAGIRKGKVASSPTATEMVKIAIADDGCGMDAETRSHMFEPFFSTKELGKGTGLGLATAYGFVSQSRGTISIDSEPGRGTVVTILLPRTTERAGARLAKQKQEVQKGTESLLLVEHDPDLRASLDQLLSDCGYCVDCAPDQQTAMRIAHICDLDAIIWDEALAGNSMDKLCEELAGVCPKAKVLFLSSSGESHRSDHCVSIHKPFDLGDLTNRLRHILDSDAES